MELMWQMMETMKSMQGNSSGGTKKSKRNPNQSKYCWTHGLCSHNSAQCRTPADGHMVNATFENRMGGSSKNISDSWSGGRDNKNLVDKLNILQNFSTTPVAPISSHSNSVFKVDTGAS